MIDIVYEDKDIIVLNKPSGVAVQTKNLRQKDLQSEVLNYLAEKMRGNSGRRPYLGIIHRLDQPVSGIVLFAKNERAAAYLSKQFQEGKAQKEYVALVSFSGALTESGQEITLTDYLVKDERNNITRVVDKNVPGSKRAILSYKIIMKDETKMQAKLAISLKTGRHHQIRAQLSNAELPIVNDTKYGGIRDTDNRVSGGEIALCARKLSFLHPSTGKSVSFAIDERF